MMKNYVIPAALALMLAACGSNGNGYDASGTFEADEVVVSAELGGRIMQFHINEGDALERDSIVGVIDATNVSLQKEQVEASIQALHEKTMDVNPQVKLLEDQLTVQQSQLDNLLHEQQRLQNLVKADAATQKQLDDMNAQVDVVKKQMAVTRQQVNVQRTNINTQNRSVLSEKLPLSKRAAQLDEQLSKANISNPISGTVITKYAEQGEYTAPGKALYKIANLSELNLRAYVTGDQLSGLKLNQPVQVLVDSGARQYRHYDGKIIWISDKAEFTPKTIQTKEERANLVYAIKVRVKNDGLLKIGMYAEVKF